jgi:hypothetical protein
MRYEVVESAGEWIVRREGTEVGRFVSQDEALNHVSERMRETACEGSASFAVRYERRTG